MILDKPIIGPFLKQVTSFSWEMEDSFPSMTNADDDRKDNPS